jgi:FkbH-like protein
MNIFPPMQFRDLMKNLDKDFSAFPNRKVALVGDSATQFLRKAIRALGCSEKLAIELFEADFDQMDAQILDKTSEMYQFKPEFIVLYPSGERLWNRFTATPTATRATFAAQILDEIGNWWKTIGHTCNAKVIHLNFVEINDKTFGNFATKTEVSFPYQVKKLNLELMNLARGHKQIFIADLAALASETGYGTAHDPRLYATAKVALALDFLPSVAKAILDIMQAASGKIHKCLVLDLDNTVWGGIIGDDGMEKIEIGELGLGHAFDSLQQWARELKNRGIILAVCSKNDEDTARKPFKEHPDMTLRLNDIAVFIANWDNKVDNLKQIQKVLNIGFDSMVFVDDNPFERNLVREFLPDVAVPELPEDPALYVPYLRSLNLFETISYSEEDLQRTRQYQVEIERTDFQKSFTSIEDYLGGLQMKAIVRPFEAYTVPRVAQLAQRSNQFNLRTIRYTDAEVEQMRDSSEFITLAFQLRDKFGDHGLIAVVILRKMENSCAFIDTWIMSCRVLKRGMEEFTVNQMAKRARMHGIQRLVGEYIPTAKNGMVETLFSRMGFIKGDSKWELDTGKFQEFNTFITESEDHA